LLMVAAAQNLPETFYGDADVGNHATSKTLDRPTELAMKSRQTFWAGVYQAIFAYVLRWALTASAGPLTGLGVITKAEDDGQLVEPIAWGTETITKDDGTTEEQPIDASIAIEFPPILAPDRKADIDAVVEAATLSGKSSVTLDETTLLRYLL